MVTALFAAGCVTKPLPDPNDLRIPAHISASQALQRLRAANELLQARQQAGTMTPPRSKQLIVLYAKDVAAAMDEKTMKPTDAWIFGAVYRSAGDWSQAKSAYEKAVQAATSEERRISDTLRLAEACVHMGEVERAIKLAHSTFDATPQGKPPILPAVLLEIAPQAIGGNFNEQLAELLVGAVDQHEQAVVDPRFRPGQAFEYAKPFHIKRALRLAIALYQGAGQTERARQIQERLNAIPR